MMNGGTGRSKVILMGIVSKIQMILGALIAAFFGLGLIGCLSQKTEVSVTIAILLFLALGVWLILRGVKKDRLVKLFQRYVALLSGDSERSLDSLAGALGVSVDAVRDNVERMIKQGLMPNAYINRDTNCLVFAGRVPAGQAASRPAAAPGGQGGNPGGTGYRTVVCKGCGAANQIPVGGTGECEFCGSRLG